MKDRVPPPCPPIGKPKSEDESSGPGQYLNFTQVIEFFRTFENRSETNTEEYLPFAIELLVRDHLSDKSFMETLYKKGKNDGFSLQTRKVGSRAVKVIFNCMPEPPPGIQDGTIGDGGEWIVKLDESGKILGVKLSKSWLS